MKHLIYITFLIFQFSYSADSISIIATANVHGEIDPCG